MEVFRKVYMPTSKFVIAFFFQPDSQQLFESTQPTNTPDIEDIGSARPLGQVKGQMKIITSVKRKRGQSECEEGDSQLTRSWREALGPPPPMGTTKV